MVREYAHTGHGNEPFQKLLLLLFTCASAQAQFSYTIENGGITIT